MGGLRDVLESYVAGGAVPGAVGLVARGGQAEVQAAGAAAFGGAPMARDSIFRLASITKPVTAAGHQTDRARHRTAGDVGLEQVAQAAHRFTFSGPVMPEYRTPGAAWIHRGGPGRPAAGDAGGRPAVPARVLGLAHDSGFDVPRPAGGR